MADKIPVSTFRVVTAVSLPSGAYFGAGEEITNIPPMDIHWLLAQGAIQDLGIPWPPVEADPELADEVDATQLDIEEGDL